MSKGPKFGDPLPGDKSSASATRRCRKKGPAAQRPMAAPQALVVRLAGCAVRQARGHARESAPRVPVGQVRSASAYGFGPPWNARSHPISPGRRRAVRSASARTPAPAGYLAQARFVRGVLHPGRGVFRRGLHESVKPAGRQAAGVVGGLEQERRDITSCAVRLRNGSRQARLAEPTPANTAATG